ncbi:DoxX family protein [Tomitella cavernea]|uniref:DoxX family protein n=1 Tax=Tomitella cavernea TaxID=1387982 RepID=A0ABP9CU07_9ACTN|nr:DoxX family protein [Tomitella cavernea]
MNDASRPSDGNDAGDFPATGGSAPQQPQQGGARTGAATHESGADTSAMGVGTSPFDEPTGEFPPATGGPGWSGIGGDEPDPETRVIPHRQVISREDDVFGPGGDEQQTTRIPSYEELSTGAPDPARREPADIAAAMDQALTDSPAKAKRGTLDIGLLVIRVVLGGILFAHGLQKLTGNWGGPDLDGFRTVLESGGFNYAHALSIAGPVGEVVVGALLVVGFLTPLAAAGAVAILINAWCFMQASTPGLQFFTNQSGAAGSGVEFETMLLAAAVGITLTGAGLLSLDVKRGWTRRPFLGSFAFLLLGVAAGVVIWVVFNGANPFA